MRKYDILVDKVIDEIGIISAQKIDAVKRVKLKEFLCKRIGFYGCKGYMFNAVLWYKRAMFEMKIDDDINLIACYILKCNCIRIDNEKLTDNQKYVNDTLLRYV